MVLKMGANFKSYDGIRTRIFTSVLRFAHAGQGEPFLRFIWVMVAFSGKIDMGTLVIETTELISGVIYDLRGLQQLQNL